MLLERTFWEKATSMHVYCLKGMGAAIGRPTVIAPELREGALVPVFEFYR